MAQHEDIRPKESVFLQTPQRDRKVRQADAPNKVAPAIPNHSYLVRIESEFRHDGLTEQT